MGWLWKAIVIVCIVLIVLSCCGCYRKMGAYAGKPEPVMVFAGSAVSPPPPPSTGPPVQIPANPGGGGGWNPPPPGSHSIPIANLNPNPYQPAMQPFPPYPGQGAPQPAPSGHAWNPPPPV